MGVFRWVLIKKGVDTLGAPRFGGWQGGKPVSAFIYLGGAAAWLISFRRDHNNKPDIFSHLAHAITRRLS